MLLRFEQQIKTSINHILHFCVSLHFELFTSFPNGLVFDGGNAVLIYTLHNPHSPHIPKFRTHIDKFDVYLQSWAIPTNLINTICRYNLYRQICQYNFLHTCSSYWLLCVHIFIIIIIIIIFYFLLILYCILP